MTVKLREAMASDRGVVEAAKVSTTDCGEYVSDWSNTAGLIDFLMKNRHGTPFEHNMFKFYIECPIFVAREFFRHRMASYNEESGRYKKLKGVFWVPDPARGLIQEGKPGHYIMKPGTKELYDATVASLTRSAEFCYKEYEYLLDLGVCREVARANLTVAVYTSFYVTMNARGLMNFLSLRIDDVDNAYETKPQYEIQQVALDMQDVFSKYMPITFNAFDKRGRVAP